MVHAPAALAALLLAAALVPAPVLAQANRARAMLEALEAVVEREPGHVGAIYTAAKTAAAAGEAALALAWLERLPSAALGDELDPDDFPSLASMAAYREHAARFAAVAPPVGHADVRELECEGLLPEGTAWDPKRRRLLVSSGRERTAYAVDASGRCTRITPPGDRSLGAVLGMQVDAPGDSLWVASTAAPFMRDARADEAGSARLARIDLATGRVAATFPLPGKGMLNDLARTADGTIYVTESAGSTIYRLAPKAKELVAVLPPDQVESPNGIVALPSGDLLVADFHGLALVRDPAGARATVERLAVGDGLYLGGIDGLATDGRRIVAIQNLVGRGRVWLLRVDVAAKRVDATLLLRGHPDFRNPTTGAIVGDEFRFVADPNLQKPDGVKGVTPLPEGRRGHRLLTLKLPAP